LDEGDFFGTCLPTYIRPAKYVFIVDSICLKSFHVGGVPGETATSHGWLHCGLDSTVHLTEIYSGSFCIYPNYLPEALDWTTIYIVMDQRGGSGDRVTFVVSAWTYISPCTSIE
jgi:hypothetical protein